MERELDWRRQREESGGGKIILLERGAYKEMDVCIMCHPGPGSERSASIGPTIAMQAIEVEYKGHSAHAGAAPWYVLHNSPTPADRLALWALTEWRSREGTNALDAAFLAYSSISLLRQQMKPEQRIHGIIQGKDWSPNVIPDYSKMRWLVRSPTYTELSSLVRRARNCFEAGALATACTCRVKADKAYYDLQQNSVLGQSFADIVGSRYGVRTTNAGTTASTDFGNVSYALPSLHPAFGTLVISFTSPSNPDDLRTIAIPTSPNGGNHTPAFAQAAATQEAHDAMLTITKGLALLGYRVLSDPQFLSEVRVLPCSRANAVSADMIVVCRLEG
ncbi:hypothetical protein NMY22_g12501 [Coprinellus aureogranulatus]|nr:hypothetical protein NMY22_g12501 [Coprinellus aureogranulatus]